MEGLYHVFVLKKYVYAFRKTNKKNLEKYSFLGNRLGTWVKVFFPVSIFRIENLKNQNIVALCNRDSGRCPKLKNSVVALYMRQPLIL